MRLIGGLELRGGDEALNIFGGWRQTDDVEIEAAEQCARIGGRVECKFIFGELFLDAGVEGIARVRLCQGLKRPMLKAFVGCCRFVISGFGPLCTRIDPLFEEGYLCRCEWIIFGRHSFIFICGGDA